MAERDHDHASAIDQRAIKPPAAFTVLELDAPAGVVILALGGELDLAAGAPFREAVSRVLDDALAPDGVVLDLEQATFMDSSMLQELLRARAELNARAVQLVLTNLCPPIERLLALTGADELLESEATREQAVARVGAASRPLRGARAGEAGPRRGTPR